MLLRSQTKQKMSKTGSLKKSFSMSNKGFTLMEVIVAIAILSISFVMVMQLFSGGLRASRASCDYTRAVVHAQDKMDEILSDPVMDSGEFEDGFQWSSVIQPFLEPEDSDFMIFKIILHVSWQDNARGKSLKLVSLKTLPKDQVF